MEFEIISLRRYGFRKVFRVVCFVILVLGISSMIKGFGGSDSLFRRLELPIWTYTMNIVFLIIMSFLGLASLSSDLPVVGVFSIEEENVILNKNGRVVRFNRGEVLELKVNQDYLRGKIISDLYIFNILIKTSTTSYKLHVKSTVAKAKALKEVFNIEPLP